MKNEVPLILRLIALSALPAALVGATLLWRFRKHVPLARYTGILLFLISMNGIVLIVPPSNALAFYIVHWFTRPAIALAIWALVLYLAGIITK